MHIKVLKEFLIIFFCTTLSWGLSPSSFSNQKVQIKKSKSISQPTISKHSLPYLTTTNKLTVFFSNPKTLSALVFFTIPFFAASFIIEHYFLFTPLSYYLFFTGLGAALFISLVSLLLFFILKNNFICKDRFEKISINKKHYGSLIEEGDFIKQKYYKFFLSVFFQMITFLSTTALLILFVFYSFKNILIIVLISSSLFIAIIFTVPLIWLYHFHHKSSSKVSTLYTLKNWREITNLINIHVEKQTQGFSFLEKERYTSILNKTLIRKNKYLSDSLSICVEKYRKSEASIYKKLKSIANYNISFYSLETLEKINALRTLKTEDLNSLTFKQLWEKLTDFKSFLKTKKHRPPGLSKEKRKAFKKYKKTLIKKTNRAIKLLEEHITNINSLERILKRSSNFTIYTIEHLCLKYPKHLSMEPMEPMEPELLNTYSYLKKDQKKCFTQKISTST